MTHVLPLLLACALLLLGPVAGAPSDPADLDYKPVVLVRNFETPGLPEHRGELAAESVAAAIEKNGLARAVRPRFKHSQEWEQSLKDVKPDNVTKTPAGNWTTDAVDVYGGLRRRTVRKEASTPHAEFVVQGTVSRVGKVWWVRATLYDATARRQIKSASSQAEGDAGIFKAASAVAGALETVYARKVLAHRSVAVIRRVNLQLMTRKAAAQRLEALHAGHPDALEPVAARLALASSAEEPDAGTVTCWTKKVIEKLQSADPEGQRFVMQLGLDPRRLLAAPRETPDAE